MNKEKKSIQKLLLIIAICLFVIECVFGYMAINDRSSIAFDNTTIDLGFAPVSTDNPTSKTLQLRGTVEYGDKITLYAFQGKSSCALKDGVSLLSKDNIYIVDNATGAPSNESFFYKIVDEGIELSPVYNCQATYTISYSDPEKNISTSPGAIITLETAVNDEYKSLANVSSTALKVLPLQNINDDRINKSASFAWERGTAHIDENFEGYVTFYDYQVGEKGNTVLNAYIKPDILPDDLYILDSRGRLVDPDDYILKARRTDDGYTYFWLHISKPGEYELAYNNAFHGEKFRGATLAVIR